MTAPRAFKASAIPGVFSHRYAGAVSGALHPVKLSWKPPDDRPSRILGYSLIWRDADGAMGVHYSRVSKTVIHLPAGTYLFTVRAVYSNVESLPAVLKATVGA